MSLPAGGHRLVVVVVGGGGGGGGAAAAAAVIRLAIEYQGVHMVFKAQVSVLS